MYKILQRKDKNGSNIKFIVFFSILIVIYLQEQRDATFYDNSAAAAQWWCVTGIFHMWWPSPVSHTKMLWQTQAGQKQTESCTSSQSLLLYTSINLSQHSFPNKTKQKGSKQYTRLAETSGTGKGIKSSNKCRYSKGKLYFMIQYLMQTSLSGIFLIDLLFWQSWGNFVCPPNMLSKHSVFHHYPLVKEKKPNPGNFHCEKQLIMGIQKCWFLSTQRYF